MLIHANIIEFHTFINNSLQNSEKPTYKQVHTMKRQGLKNPVARNGS